MRSMFARKDKHTGNETKRPVSEIIRLLTKKMYPPMLIEEARKSDAALDSDLRFVEKLSGKPFREGMKIVYCEFKSFVPIGGINKSDDDHTIYLNLETKSNDLVHELVHAQCNIFGNGNPARPYIRQVYSEGLAIFGECQRLGSKIRYKVRAGLVANMLLAEGAFGMFFAVEAKSLLQHFFQLPVNDLKQALAFIAIMAIDLITLGLAAGGAYLIGIFLRGEFRYLPFTKSLFKLADEVKDAPKAFQIAAEKEPKTWKDLLFPLKFYAQEIADAKKGEAPAAR